MSSDTIATLQKKKQHIIEPQVIVINYHHQCINSKHELNDEIKNENNYLYLQEFAFLYYFVKLTDDSYYYLNLVPAIGKTPKIL